MASLINTKIKDTYEGLIKTLDNLALTGTAKGITDGGGNPTNITMSTTSTNFPSGTVDFTGATVTGDNNSTYSIGSVQDGLNADIKLTDNASGESKVTLVAGTNITLSNSGNDLTINAASGAAAGLVVGTGTSSLQNAVGTASNASGAQSIALGADSTASGAQSMAYGNNAQATSTSAAAFGEYAEATNNYAIAFGRTSGASGDGAVAFGQQTSAAQAGAVAMGRQVTSDTADTTHVRALKIVAPDGAALGGNGITFLSADGTAGVVTLLDSDELALDGVAIGGGGGGAGGLVLGTGTDSLASALTTIPGVASAADTIAIGDNAQALNQQSIALGHNALTGTSAPYAIAIGKGSQALDDWNVAIGGDAFTYSRYNVAIGGNASAGESGSATGGESAVAIGNQPVANSKRAIAIGYDADALADDAIAIGARADATATGAIAIGSDTSSSVAPKATAVNAVALGNNIIANTADTVSITLLQIMNYATMSFADDAAAATGGIPLGGVYHTSGALKIRIA